MGMKTLLALETGLKTEASRLEARNEARREGRSYYAYTEYTLTEPRGTMAIRPDGKAIYALNSQTSDVTIIDGATGEIIIVFDADYVPGRLVPPFKPSKELKELVMEESPAL